MLEHVPRWLGAAIKGMRAGTDKLAIVQPGLGGRFDAIDLMSPAFADGARLPPRFTADGAGVSPPLVWGNVPAGTSKLVLLVEDADAPAPAPLVHAILWGMPADERRIAEGAIVADGAGAADGRDVGRSSFLREGWLPPDPPSGHGEHRYAFQLFALDGGVADPGETPRRAALIKAMSGHVLAAGLLIGCYSRGDPTPKMRGATAALRPA